MGDDEKKIWLLKHVVKECESLTDGSSRTNITHEDFAEAIKPIGLDRDKAHKLLGQLVSQGLLKWGSIERYNIYPTQRGADVAETS